MRILIYLAIAPMLCLTETQTSKAQTWPQFGGPTRDFRVPDSLTKPMHTPTKRWQQTLGLGMSSVVVKDDVVFTSYLMPFDEPEQKKPENERVHREAIVAFDADDGKMRWQHEYAAGWIESQQAFGGRSRAPQATPTICGDYLVTIGFTGIIHCLDRNDGHVVWQRDAVKDFKATPVQFGFSASPLVHGDRIFLLTGGELGGLVCLDTRTGEKIWNLPTNEASYATPVFWQHSDGTQIVFTTRNRVVAADPETGKQLWEYTFEGKGMTNVPTPMPVGETGIVISGQGVKGTRRLEVLRQSASYEVSETWKSDEQFFYCNWLQHDGQLFGCNGSLLASLDVENGKTTGRFRGFNDSNLLLLKGQMLIFHGDGHLSTFKLSDSEMQAIGKFSVIEERCWVPPTLHKDYLFVRGGDQLLCLDMAGGDPRAAVTSSRIRKQVLKFRKTNAAPKTATAMEQILATFESDGADAAWKKYNRLRDDDPDSLSLQQRSNLAEMANGKGLHDFAKMILKHAAEDFPEEAKQVNQKPSSEITRGDNGLLYLEFLVQNTGKQTIQAEVQGPAKQPFSYGLPLPSRKPRLEKWPVGTKLYRTVDGIRKDVLLTVEAEFAGQTIEIPEAKH